MEQIEKEFHGARRWVERLTLWRHAKGDLWTHQGGILALDSDSFLNWEIVIRKPITERHMIHAKVCSSMDCATTGPCAKTDGHCDNTAES